MPPVSILVQKFEGPTSNPPLSMMGLQLAHPEPAGAEEVLAADEVDEID